MEEKFLERESRLANKRNRKFFTIMLLVWCGFSALFGFTIFKELDLSIYDDRKLFIGLCAVLGLLLFFALFGLIRACKAATKGGNLILPCKENTKEEIAKIINREAAEGGIMVDEYIDSFPEGKKPYGERVVLTSSYLLLFNGRGMITAIPREKIYWLCAQVGIKGTSTYRVRLLVFTHNGTFTLDGFDINHAEMVADKLYKYIPNIFADYDTFELSYELLKLYDKNRPAFLEFYESAITKERNASIDKQ